MQIIEVLTNAYRGRRRAAGMVIAIVPDSMSFVEIAYEDLKLKSGGVANPEELRVIYDKVRAAVTAALSRADSLSQHSSVFHYRRDLMIRNLHDASGALREMDQALDRK
jgi:hypothetical protein